MSEYQQFLQSKRIATHNYGPEISDSDINPMLFQFQRDCVRWAVRKGRAAIFLDTGLGKALPVDTKIMTPSGYRQMGDLRIGDRVVGADGKATNVTGVFPQGIRPAYAVTFSDGVSVICDGDHLWSVRTKAHKHRNESYRPMTTKQIMANGLVSQEGWKWFIPMADPIEFDEHELPLDPYLLGVILGDGGLTISTPTLSSADEEIIETVAKLLPGGVKLIKAGGYDWRLSTGKRNGRRSNPNLLTHELRKLGLMGKKSEGKFIPEIYKFAGIESRIRLLQGLMDTDGYASPDGNVNYCTVSKQLAEDMAFLVQSLGGRTPIRTKKTSGQLAYQMSLCLPNKIVPFSLSRKLSIYKPRTKYFPTRAITAIESRGEYDMVCISVDAEDCLYVIEHAIVTHNTFIHLEWARLLGQRTLIVAPLSVARQTVREAVKLGIAVHYTRDGQDIVDGQNITNYEMLDRFNPADFGAVVLDESSILKALDGKTRRKLTEMFTDTPFRLCCTATPAPNDHVELGNHAEFLGICTEAEMRAMFFVNANKEHTFEIDGKMYRKKGSNQGGQEWRLKHHAEEPFYQWLASWAISLTKPSDLGYDDDGFLLPMLNILPQFIPVQYTPDEQLFFTSLHGIADRASMRRRTLPDRLEALKELINQDNTAQWIVWVGLDDESRAATEALSGAVEVKGSDSPESKATAFEDFQDGKYRILVTKGRIGGFGMNFQCASNMAFLGLNDSWELWYQCIRRAWRYGQKQPVQVHIIMLDLEAEIYHNVMRKDAMARRLRQGLIDHIKTYEREELTMSYNPHENYEQRENHGEKWRLLQGDSCERLKELADNSVDMSVYSPPFASLFVYSNTNRDLGNSRDWDEFFEHYRFIIQEVLRVTKPGRLTCVHTSDIPAMQSRDGYIGIRDFPGAVIAAYEAEGLDVCRTGFRAEESPGAGHPHQEQGVAVRAVA